VLPTYKCRCVQFLLFHACSFNEAFSATFCQFLLSQLRSEHVHMESRMGCVSYLVSFLARAQFVAADLVISAAHEVVSWATDYQQAVVARVGSASIALDVHLHGPFYTAIQGLLLLLCYKVELYSTPQAASARAELATSLHGLLHGPLNPLKFCLDAIAVEFERLGVCECADLLMANERVVVASHTVGGGPNRLEDFFPFDPLHGSRQTSAIIAPVFQEWQPRSGGTGARESNTSALSQSEGAESLARSLQGMSVTPCSGDDLISGRLEMGDHMRRRLRENHSLFSSMMGGSPGRSPEFARSHHAPPDFAVGGHHIAIS